MREKTGFSEGKTVVRTAMLMIRKIKNHHFVTAIILFSMFLG